jgi:hypothetical protein
MALTSNGSFCARRNRSPILFPRDSRGRYDCPSNRLSRPRRASRVKKTSASGEQKTFLVLLRVAVCALDRQLIIPRFFITVTVAAAAMSSWRFLCYTNICRILTQKLAALCSSAADGILRAGLTEELFCSTNLPLARSRSTWVSLPMRGRPLLTSSSVRDSDGICGQSFA